MGLGELQVKRRAACEECRVKKLKCTGERPACSRCQRGKLPCLYSLQKQMGRPKKRQRIDGNAIQISAHQHQQLHAGCDNDMGLALDDSNVGEHSTTVSEFGIQQSRNPITDWPALPWQEAMPGLMPDSSNGSAPLINPPDELRGNVGEDNHARGQNRDTSMLTQLEPPLPAADLGRLPSALPSCACLSTIYLILDTLQAIESFNFPFDLHPLREAMQTASEVLTCDKCPTKFMTALQNSQLVGTLLVIIAERFSKVLGSINSEAERADAGRETKKFRVSDLNISTSHLHTGGIGCAAVFQIDLSPAEWRAMTKKVVLSEVYGTVDGSSCCPYLLGLIQDMRDRQTKWHQPEFALPSDFPKSANGTHIGGKRIPDENHVCLRMVGYAEALVRSFDWS